MEQFFPLCPNIVQRRLHLLGIFNSAPPEQRIRIQEMLLHNLPMICRKMDYISFIRFWKTCRKMYYLVESVVKDFRISVTDGFNIDLQTNGGFTLTKNKDKHQGGTLTIGIKRLEKVKVYNMESLLNVLKGFVWSSLTIINVTDPQLEEFLNILTKCVPQCTSINFRDVPKLSMDRLIANKKPTTVIISDVQLNIEYYLDPIMENLKAVKNLILNSNTMEMHLIPNFARGRVSFIARKVSNPGNLRDINLILISWIQGSPLTYLQIELRFARTDEWDDIICNLDVVPFINRKLQHLSMQFTANSINDLNSNILMESWLVRSNQLEEGRPVYGLLSYRKEGVIPTITFQKLPRSPSCPCEAIICVETLASVFHDFVASCYPIDLSELKKDLLSAKSVNCIGGSFELFIYRQTQLLIDPKRNPFCIKKKRSPERPRRRR